MESHFTQEEYNLWQLTAMNDLMKTVANSDLHIKWIQCFPEYATQEEITDLAKDNTRFVGIVKCFLQIMADINAAGNIQALTGLTDVTA